MNKKAKPGDTIVITSDDTIHKGEEYFVVECPEDEKDTSWKNETWVIMDGKNYWFHNDWCKIVKQSDVVKETNRCEDCRGTGKIALLTTVVDCDCITLQPIKLNEGPQDFPEDSDILNAWFSPSVAVLHGRVVYLSPTGEEVEITEISRKAIPCGNHTDAKFVGTVNKRKYVRGSLNY